MNMLFVAGESVDAAREIAIPRADRRYEHILKVLKKAPGDEISAGSADGFLGMARILSVSDAEIRLSFRPEKPAEPLHPLRLILGFPRPIQANRILKDISSLGAAQIWLTVTELTEKSYMKSDIFANREFSSALIEGAEQAGNPRLPEVKTFWSLKRALDALDALDTNNAAEKQGLSELIPQFAASGTRIALHPDSQAVPISALSLLEKPVTLAIGSERGWTEQEAALLQHYGFTICSMGRRILKTETATVAAVSIILSKLNLL